MPTSVFSLPETSSTSLFLAVITRSKSLALRNVHRLGFRALAAVNVEFARAIHEGYNNKIILVAHIARILKPNGVNQKRRCRAEFSENRLKKITHTLEKQRSIPFTPLLEMQSRFATRCYVGLRTKNAKTRTKPETSIAPIATVHLPVQQALTKFLPMPRLPRALHREASQTERAFSLKEMHAVLQQPSHLETIPQFALVANNHFRHITACILLNIANPSSYVVERFLVGDVVHKDDSLQEFVWSQSKSKRNSLSEIGKPLHHEETQLSLARQLGPTASKFW